MREESDYRYLNNVLLYRYNPLPDLTDLQRYDSKLVGYDYSSIACVNKSSSDLKILMPSKVVENDQFSG